MKKCPTCEATYPSRFSVCPQDGAKLVESGGWSEGTVIRGKYRILSKVGQGGMGAVYKALHVTFDELRALKVMNPDLLRDELFVKRFKQEAIIARRLDHPNAVRVEDLDESEDGLPFMVMEYIEGESLKSLIEQRGPLPAARTTSIAKQVAAALDAAHRLGMVHRDVKPANVVLIQGPRGEQAKVLDFGIAKIKEVRASDSGMTLTGTGIVMGTPQYMSPEQALGKRGDQLDGRSDLYSLGVVMYQMLTGELPFKADTTVQLLLAHINTPPRPILEAKPEISIPPGLARLVMKCLEKDPNKRPATGAALIEELAAESGPGGAESALGAPAPDMATMIAAPRRGVRDYSETVQAAATPPGANAAIATQTPPAVEQPLLPVTPVGAAEPARPRKAWLLGIAAAVIVLIAAAAVWYLRFRPLPSAAPVRTAGRTVRQAPLTPQVQQATPSVAQPTTTQPTAQQPPTFQPPAAQPAAPATSAANPPATTPTEPENRKPGRTATAENVPPKQVKRQTKLSASAASPRVTLSERQPSQPGAQSSVASNQTSAASPSAAPANPELSAVVVTTSPGAEISIDGKKEGTANSKGELTVQNLSPGSHTAVASLQGFPDIEVPFMLPPGAFGGVNLRWGVSQTMATAVKPAQPQSGSGATATQGVAASYPVDYLRRFGSSKGLLAIEGNTIRYQPSDGKDAFSSSLAGIGWGSTGGDIFYIRLRNGRTYKFRSRSSAAIVATFRRAVGAPALQGAEDAH